MIDELDGTATKLSVSVPSGFVWHNPMDDEGELDKISSDEFAALELKHNATRFWIPLEAGINTFSTLSSRYSLRGDYGDLSEREDFIAFEVACFRDALVEAVSEGEEAFHIQCY